MADRIGHQSGQLHDEIGRIPSTFGDLSATVSPAAAQDPDEYALEEGTVRSAIRQRRLREIYFPRDLFADPAWDMMLELLLSEIRQQKVTVSNLCDAAGVAATTALRWQKCLLDRGLIVRRADRVDARRIYVELTPETSIALRRYFTEVWAPGR